MAERDVQRKKQNNATLANGPMAQVGVTVDDDNRTAKYLCDPLDVIYRMSNTQIVINIEGELEILPFVKDTMWESHLSLIHI